MIESEGLNGERIVIGADIPPIRITTVEVWYSPFDQRLHDKQYQLLVGLLEMILHVMLETVSGTLVLMARSKSKATMRMTTIPRAVLTVYSTGNRKTILTVTLFQREKL